MPNRGLGQRLSNLQRVPVRLHYRRRLNALRTLSAQGLLQLIHGNRIQMSNLQKECCQHGSPMAETDPRDRKSADARAVLEYTCDHPMQRLLCKVIG
jgi:hypothetical protein